MSANSAYSLLLMKTERLINASGRQTIHVQVDIAQLAEKEDNPIRKMELAHFPPAPTPPTPAKGAGGLGAFVLSFEVRD